MSDKKYEALFSLLLDITTCTHIPLKLFAIYVIVRHTPPQLRHYSYFTLNTMFWNFLCNFITAFIHFYPLYPAVCFRANGISSHFVKSKDLGYFLYLLIVFFITECSIALLFAFPHRYIVFVHPQLAACIKPAWVFALCGVSHVAFALLYFPITSKMGVCFKNCSSMAELPDTEYDFCLNPNGMVNIVLECIYATGVAVGILVIVASSVLFLRKVRKLQKVITNEQTLALQKKVFASLLTLTGVAMLFGGVPFVLIVFAFIFPVAPYNREIFMISVVVLSNHGGVSAIAYLVFFKAYRDAVKRIFSSLINRLTRRKTKVRPVVVALSNVK